jgi:dTDP-4-dehydrorhamnose reductase
MKILIIGASGLIGGYLMPEFKALGQTKGTAFPQSEGFITLDMRDAKEASRLFGEYKPDIVICAAAISNVEYCQQEPVESAGVNIEGTKNIINLIKESGAKFIFLSSEYVFDGQAGPYSEEDKASPINEYGRQKLEIERFIQKELKDYLIIRTTVVYGWERQGKNFVIQLLKKLSCGIKMNVPSDQISSPTYAAELALAIRQLIEKDKRGIYNIVGSQVMSRYDFAKEACKVFGLDLKLLVPVTTEKLAQKAKRPLKAGLKIEKIKMELGIPFLQAAEGLKKMRSEKSENANINL